MAEEIERIYVIPLKKTGFKSSKSADSAVKRVKDYLKRHMKVKINSIWIDDSLNNSLWSHGKYKIPSKIRVKAVKFDDGVVEAYIPELEFKKSRRELLKEEKSKKEPILKKEEIASEEGEDEKGAEDYDIAPTIDGDVKIKKKKAPKVKKEEKPKKAKKSPKPEKKPKEKKEKSKSKAKKKDEPKKRKETKSKTMKKSKK